MENGLLTPSLKVRRKKVYERFRSDDFEALYDGPPPEGARKSEREAQA